jgi:hypothetical protein
MHIDAEVHSLLHTTSVGMLATVGDVFPLASAVPFIALKGWAELLLHISTLAAHTQNLLRDPRLSLLIMETDAPPEESSCLETTQLARYGGPDRSANPDLRYVGSPIHRPLSRCRNHDVACRLSTLAPGHTDRSVHRRVRPRLCRSIQSTKCMAAARPPRLQTLAGNEKGSRIVLCLEFNVPHKKNA